MVRTSLTPRALLEALLGIERSRARSFAEQRWGPRTLDLDLLLYADRAIDEPGLTVPIRASMSGYLCSSPGTDRGRAAGAESGPDRERVARGDG